MRILLRLYCLVLSVAGYALCQISTNLKKKKERNKERKRKKEKKERKKERIDKNKLVLYKMLLEQPKRKAAEGNISKFQNSVVPCQLSSSLQVLLYKPSHRLGRSCKTRKKEKKKEIGGVGGGGGGGEEDGESATQYNHQS